MSFLARIFNPKKSSTKVKFRREGDAARDAKRWNEAAANYSAYLTLAPDDNKIFVQCGNCLKEAGKLEQSLAAYDSAIALDDADSDVFLQRGHLLKLMGRPQEAAVAYRRSFELNPHENPAFEELLGLQKGGSVTEEAPSRPIIQELSELTMLAPWEGDRPPPTNAAVIYLDITDLTEYLRSNVSLSGIQRVLANIILNATAFAEGPGGLAVVPVLPDYNGSKIYSVRISLLDGMLGMVAGGQIGRDEINSALDLVMASRSPVSPVPGDTLMIAGAFWIYHRYDLLNALRQNGVRVAVFIHDLIQITNAEYVEPKAELVFRRSFVDILMVSNYILTNSNFVAQEVRNYLSSRMNFHIPVKAITLATELGAKHLDIRAVQEEYIELAKEEYVLCVSTIEIRKNHAYLIKIWERMIAEGKLTVPNLVLVGKWGWQIDALREHLANSDYLGGRLFIYNAISDMDLAYFYRNCLFTVYPSFAEGWGLPVGESLGYGKPCIASGVTAIPEVGGELCRYFDPFDIETGYHAISETLEDRKGLAEWTERVRTNFSPKSWQKFSFEFLRAVTSFAKDRELDATGNNFILETSEVAFFGSDMLVFPDSEPHRIATARMSRMAGWHGLEGWGCWAMRRRAFLRFRTRLQHGEEAVLYLYLKTAEGDDIADCTVKSGSKNTLIRELRPVPSWCTAPVEVGEDGIVDICLVSGKGYFHRHGRELYIGVLAIAITPANDQNARLNLLDNIVPMFSEPGKSIGDQTRIEPIAMAAQ